MNLNTTISNKWLKKPFICFLSLMLIFSLIIIPQPKKAHAIAPAIPIAAGVAALFGVSIGVAGLASYDGLSLPTRRDFEAFLSGLSNVGIVALRSLPVFMGAEAIAEMANWVNTNFLNRPSGESGIGHVTVNGVTYSYDTRTAGVITPNSSLQDKIDTYNLNYIYSYTRTDQWSGDTIKYDVYSSTYTTSIAYSYERYRITCRSGISYLISEFPDGTKSVNQTYGNEIICDPSGVLVCGDSYLYVSPYLDLKDYTTDAALGGLTGFIAGTPDMLQTVLDNCLSEQEFSELMDYYANSTTAIVSSPANSGDISSGVVDNYGDVTLDPPALPDTSIGTSEWLAALLAALAAGEISLEAYLEAVQSAVQAGVLEVDVATDAISYAYNFDKVSKKSPGNISGGISSSMNDLVDSVSGKFPFCIPYDITLLIDALQKEPVTPVLSLSFPVPGTNATDDFEIDLEDWNDVAALLRTILLGLSIFGIMRITLRLFDSVPKAETKGD